MKAQMMTRIILGGAMLLSLSAPSYAVPVFFQWGGEKIVKIMDLPDSPSFRTPDGKHVDVGYRYQQVTVFFIPAWNYNENWCGYIGSDNEYINIDREGLSELAAASGIKLPDSPSLPFWDSIGGKLLLGLLLLLYIGYKKGGAEKKVAAGETQSGVGAPKSASSP